MRHPRGIDNVIALSGFATSLRIIKKKWDRTNVVAGVVVEVDALIQVGGGTDDHEAMEHQRVVQVDEERYLHIEWNRSDVKLLQFC